MSLQKNNQLADASLGSARPKIVQSRVYTWSIC